MIGNTIGSIIALALIVAIAVFSVVMDIKFRKGNKK